MKFKLQQLYVEQVEHISSEVLDSISILDFTVSAYT